MQVDGSGGLREGSERIGGGAKAQTRADGTSAPPRPTKIAQRKKESVGLNRQILCKVI